MFRKLNDRLRFNVRSVMMLMFVVALSSYILRLHQQIHALQTELTAIRGFDASNFDSVESSSYTEVVLLKEKGQIYMNRVFLAADGTKRAESLTSKNGLVTVYDDEGVQRIHLRPSSRKASIFVNPENPGRGNVDLRRRWGWVNSVISKPGNRFAENYINGQRAVGFKEEIKQGNCVVWASEDSGTPLVVEIDTDERKTWFVDIRTNEELDGSLFSFDAPPGYAVVEKHTIQ